MALAMVFLWLVPFSGAAMAEEESLSREAPTEKVPPAEAAPEGYVPFVEVDFTEDTQTMGNCTAGIICGKISNESSRSVRIGNNWCGDESVSVGGPSCGGSGTGSGYKWLKAGETSSKYFKDTDTFGVIKGCTITGYWDSWVPGSAFAYTVDKTTWFRVRDPQHVIITGYACP
ncbi:hypothetical protein [Nocardiopsis sp. LDBS1602]|uniref:hypothetical protein n=1 Tax=Nocardiopsis sp. LDBS1602 TaxID=3109597 RepID=UPI002DB99ED4|nr:hypothetical protein [Nocardiopsis sp. LDBS1602]MEC3891648.1 hypothetical protein [Nocardiopsis sp. LDBS1602]